jgi:hypothetical protein
MKNILGINAHLKYVEFLLGVYDNAPESMTLKEIREEFTKRFQNNDILLNQNFGIYRLLPLVLIKEEYKNQKKEFTEDITKIKIIRDSIAHHKFEMSEKGYIFENDKNKIEFTYDEFTIFLHRIENEFYSNN